MRYLITFSYDGSNFYGYQKQPNLRTIEGEIEDALKFINGGIDVTIHSSGRTDRKVHAINQKAHFDLNKNISLYKLKCALNTYTKNDIYVKNIEIVDDNFHARFMVKKKIYEYKINIGEYDPLNRNYIYQYNKPLNVDIIKKEIKNLIGTHDFSSFANMEDERSSYVRTIYDAYVNVDNNIITITFIGNGFLKYQVRNMVGALIDACNKNVSIVDIMNKKDRKSYGKTAPPEGLYLIDVKY